MRESRWYRQMSTELIVIWDGNSVRTRYWSGVIFPVLTIFTNHQNNSYERDMERCRRSNWVSS